MVYESDISDRVYPTVLTDETLLNIRANEVLRLSDGDAPFADLWKRNLESLSLQEKKAVHEFLLREANRFTMLRDKAKNIVQRTKDNSTKVATLEDYISWYDGHIARLKKGADYIKTQFHNFPLK